VLTEFLGLDKGIKYENYGFPGYKMSTALLDQKMVPILYFWLKVLTHLKMA